MSDYSTSELAAWLREQIAEDKRVASANALNLWPGETLRKVAESETHYAWQPHDVSPPRIAHILRHDPRSVLAQCEAHAALLDLVDDQRDSVYGEPGEFLPDEWARVVRLLALAYRHRPGYREEWTP